MAIGEYNRVDHDFYLEAIVVKEQIIKEFNKLRISGHFLFETEHLGIILRILRITMMRMEEFGDVETALNDKADTSSLPDIGADGYLELNN